MEGSKHGLQLASGPDSGDGDQGLSLLRCRCGTGRQADFAGVAVAVETNQTHTVDAQRSAAEQQSSSNSEGM